MNPAWDHPALRPSFGIPASLLTGDTNYSGGRAAAAVMLQIFCERVEAAFRSVIKQITVFGRSIYAVACKSYLRHHQRLPGSDRTSRLRKKRLTRVMGWFLQELRK
jgi:hypothetical protein